MTTADNPDHFEKRWNEHITQLNSLGLSLPPEKIEELEEHRDALKDLVEVAVEELEEDNYEG